MRNRRRRRIRRRGRSKLRGVRGDIRRSDEREWDGGEGRVYMSFIT